MPSFADSAVIFVIALLLFGPKKLPELARYLGKMMGEFRRASSEFRLQMDDEFRSIEQAEQQKKIEAMQTAAPPAAVNNPERETAPALPLKEGSVDGGLPVPEHHIDGRPSISSAAPDPLPIASNGDLHLMPPATGFPVSRSASSNSMSAVFDAIPHASEEAESATHG